MVWVGRGGGVFLSLDKPLFYTDPAWRTFRDLANRGSHIDVFLRRRLNFNGPPIREDYIPRNLACRAIE